MSTDRHETDMGTEAAIDDEGAAAVADDLEPTSTSTQISPEPNASNYAGGNENDTADVEEEAARPETPLHSVFSARQKRFICAMASMGSFFSPLSNFIYLPALTTLSQELRVSNASINLTVTSYQIFQGLAPMFFGDLADAGGRRPVYIICFTIYLGANLGLALQNSYTALFVFRALQSTGSSGTIALGNGVMADIVTSAERGKYIGWVQAGIMVGPALGPTIGGLLSEFLGWRAIFWFLVITAGTYLAAYVILVPETGRNVVGNGSIRPPPLNMSLLDYMNKWKAAKSGIEEEGAQAKAELANKRKLRFPNPLNSLRIVVEKDVAVVLFFASLMVTIFYCMMVEIPSFFQNIYGFNDLQIGLCYIPFSVGSAVGSIVGGKVLDYNYKRTARRIGVTPDRKRGDDLRNFPIERARLEAIMIPNILGLIAIIGFGWIIEARTSLAAPLIDLFFAGMFMTGTTSMIGAMLVDLYPQSPATAMAALNLTRCSMSAAGTAVVQHIVDAMGAGWCFTLLGLMGIVSTPLLLVVMKWGPKWREERFQRVQRMKKEGEEKRLVQEARNGGDNSGEQIMTTGGSGEMATANEEVRREKEQAAGQGETKREVDRKEMLVVACRQDPRGTLE